ncbi:Grx4 family monothiol glutaredoxin [Phenylobacterium sp.]|uniref:Grx4 family monothiol glutaredoxin n=1 Tax=Phenylobacterium sp. TaxID=1871053 RepID=UPI002EDBB4B5
MSEAAAANPVHDWIAKSVAEHPVILFMKGVPEQPQCGFSAVTVQILDHLGVDFVGVNVLQNDQLREGIKTFSDWPTIPQLYVKGEFVGGCDIVREMFQSGELKTMLAEQGLIEA